MTPPNDDTALIVEAYRNGIPFSLEVLQVECGHYMDKRLVPQAKAAIRAARDAGMFVSIRRAFATMEEQTRLHDGFEKGLPGFNPADPPGHSRHQLGSALDLAFGSLSEREEFAALAVAHGASRPVEREPWHFLFSPQPQQENA